MRLSAYETYCMYLSLKFHFSAGTYDYFKYRGKVKTTPDSFDKRKDKYSFQRLSKLYSPEEMQNFLVANFIHSKIGWIGDLLSDEATGIFKAFMKRRESFTYIIRSELSSAVATVGEPKELFKAEKDSLPPIVMSNFQGVIGIDVLSVVDDFIPFAKNITEDFLWPDINLRMTKLKPFITYDKVKIKEVLKELLS